MNPSRPVLVKGNSLMGAPLLDVGKTWVGQTKGEKNVIKTVKNAGQDQQNPLHTHLEGVLCHAGQAVVGGSRGNSTNTQLSNLISFTELRNTFWLHSTHQSLRQREKETGEEAL